jgi:hypothetical protein
MHGVPDSSETAEHACAREKVSSKRIKTPYDVSFNVPFEADHRDRMER